MAEPRSQTGAYLVALTPESSDAIRAREINIPHLPFRVGRESRRFRWTELGLVGERRRAAPPNNDLYLADETEPMNVSREHFLISREGPAFYLLDRGSRCGTIVEGEVYGAGGEPRANLADHHVIIVGTSLSRYIFKFRLEV
ncbi:MAG TPA: FHA domain-containing protein [Candidatus Polarisedimenticolia bacterium]|nr:FHA domain-containing protein [Candidatus Polarisedimenticolia bacterium]